MALLGTAISGVNVLAMPDFEDHNSHSPLRQDLKVVEATSAGASPHAEHICNPSPLAQRDGETGSNHKARWSYGALARLLSGYLLQ